MGRVLTATDLWNSKSKKYFDELNPQIMHLLNENGLCESVDDVVKAIPFQKHGDAEWNPCYVYKVILNEKNNS